MEKDIYSVHLSYIKKELELINVRLSKVEDHEKEIASLKMARNLIVTVFGGLWGLLLALVGAIGFNKT